MLGDCLVGRTAEVARVRAAWAERARPAVALFTGGPGVGKSALVREVLAQLRPERVLAGQARLRTPAPYDWLAAVLRGRDLDTLPTPADALGWLAQQPVAPPQRYAPGALLRLAVQLVRHLIGSGPALVVVEDLHALDPASLTLVAELAHTPDLPVLLLVTSRPSADPLAALALAQIAGAPGAIRHDLGPLSLPQVRELVLREYPHADTELVRRLWRRSAGNPAVLRELLSGAAEPPTLPASAEPELTGREREVLRCLAGGMSNKQVARHLDISIRTVAVHVSNVLRKTGSASRTEAALWAVRNPDAAALITSA